MASPAPARASLSDADFQRWVALTSLEFSRKRIPGVPPNTETDWRHACVHWLNKLMTRELSLNQLEDACYRHFEAVWLDELKEHIAFHRWMEQQNDAVEKLDARELYWQACDDLRERLVKLDLKANPPAPVVIRYLKGVNRTRLIADKTARLAHSAHAQATAETYVTVFYDHIVPAVQHASAVDTLEVLKALKSGGSLPGEPDIVNGFEALVAVQFLAPDTVEALWVGSRGVTKQSTF